MAANVSADFINRTLHNGSRFNVYAFGKIADIARSLIDGTTLSNAINNAVVKSLFRCKKAGVGFTLEIAKAAASDKIRIDPTISRNLVRHTVSASTAPTQASSTMQALETLWVMRIQGSRRSPVYEVLDTPIAPALETMCPWDNDYRYNGYARGIIIIALELVQGIIIIGFKVAKPSQVDCNRRYRAKLKQDRDEGHLKIEKLTAAVSAMAKAREADKAIIAALTAKVAAGASSQFEIRRLTDQVARLKRTRRDDKEQIDWDSLDAMQQ